MSTIATKLFREPKEAKQAVSDLKAKGYKDDDIVVLASEARSKDLGADIKTIPDAGKLSDMGANEDLVNYYQSSVPMGSIVVGIKTDESKIDEAKALLRAVPVCSLGDRIINTSPGFHQASRMSATNPIDAPMSGDFRRY